MTNKASGRRIKVTFTPAQYDRIKEDAAVWETTIPKLMKQVYFHPHKKYPPFAPSDQRLLVAEINRIRNNLNQISKHVDRCEAEGWNPDIARMHDMLNEIQAAIVGA